MSIQYKAFFILDVTILINWHWVYNVTFQLFNKWLIIEKKNGKTHNFVDVFW